MSLFVSGWSDFLASKPIIVSSLGMILPWYSLCSKAFIFSSWAHSTTRTPSFEIKWPWATLSSILSSKSFALCSVTIVIFLFSASRALIRAIIAWMHSDVLVSDKKLSFSFKKPITTIGAWDSLSDIFRKSVVDCASTFPSTLLLAAETSASFSTFVATLTEQTEAR